jgi:hypothetical protein
MLGRWKISMFVKSFEHSQGHVAPCFAGVNNKSIYEKMKELVLMLRAITSKHMIFNYLVMRALLLVSQPKLLTTEISTTEHHLLYFFQSSSVPHLPSSGGLFLLR